MIRFSAIRVKKKKKKHSVICGLGKNKKTQVGLWEQVTKMDDFRKPKSL